MLSDSKLARANQLSIEQKIKNRFLLQRKAIDHSSMVTVTKGNVFHIDRARQLGNNDTSTAYHMDVTQTALRMMTGIYENGEAV